MKKKAGFTLIELMIVITVISILTTMGFFAFSRVQQQARDARRKGDLRALSQAVQAYANDNSGNYPAAGTNLTTALVPTYMPVVPTDPKSGSYTYNGNATPGTQFSVCGTLEAPVVATSGIWKVSQTYPGGHAVLSTDTACALE